MAYTGFIGSTDYARKSASEEITGTWTFTQTIQGTAYRALWGDLAENYLYDECELLPKGSLVKLGGQFEITKTKRNDRDFFGVISSNPGVILNKKETNGEKIALVGRVPCRTVGAINKFDRLTTSHIPGVAKRKTWLDKILLKPTVGIALHTDSNPKEKLVEIVVKAHI